jgi:putative addiction module component (TIGR02574 family)
MATAEQVLRSALDLSDDERAEVAHRLLLSLEPDGIEDGADEAWAQEIRQRLAAIREGQMVLSDWNDALARIRHSIRAADKG